MKRFFILFVTMTACIAAWAAEGYAVYTQSNHTLTFYYGTKPSGAFDLNSGINYPEWYNYGTYAAVERVVFDPSFAQARPTTTAYWFCAMENLTTITGLNYLNTSEVTNMHGMFYGCNKLTSLDVSGFNTANVTDMRFMFHECENLTSLDLSSFNTANVTDMGCMFEYCRSLTSLDMSSFNTAKVTNMFYMFYYCSKLTSLDLSSFNTAKVTSMSWMFNGCYNLTSLDVSSFNTANVTSMGNMFGSCYNLTSLDVSGFNTAKVTNMNSMFVYCNNLTSLDLRNFNTANVINMMSMFCDCENLTSLDLSSFNTAKVTSMSWMFSGCENLTSVDLSSFNTANVINMESMFNGCNNLTSVDLSSFNTANVTNMKSMFKHCDELKTITVGSTWSTEAVTSSEDMFANCFKIEGGAGTTYSSSYTDASYAHIDGGTSNPGYLTGVTYDLWINGVLVTYANQNSVTGPGISGSVTYDPSTNTLTLNNATIDQRGLSECAISTAYGAPANLKIKLVGTNKILANDNTIAINIKESQGFTLYGSGSLDCGGALYLSVRDHLTNDATMSYIKDCTLYVHDIMSEDYEECLTIDNADVTTEYLDVGSDHNGYKGLNLVNCYVASPANGVVGNGGCIMVNGNYWDGHVEIKRSGLSGDVNGDGFVTAADVTALYDYMLNNDSSNIVNGDQDGDGHITAGDITMVYTIMLGQ
jgi:surface protein